MKSTIILNVSALAAGAIASNMHSNVHAVADLVARAMDPATMDPTKLSILSVLKTAVPTISGTDIALPTGDILPQWYKDLPADVVVLLAQMYPGAPSTSTHATTSTTSNVTSAQQTFATSPTVAAQATGLSTGSPSEISANGTLSTGSPSPTQSVFSADARSAVGTGKMSILVGLSVAAAFFAFA